MTKKKNIHAFPLFPDIQFHQNLSENEKNIVKKFNEYAANLANINAIITYVSDWTYAIKKNNNTIPELRHTTGPAIILNTLNPDALTNISTIQPYVEIAKQGIKSSIHDTLKKINDAEQDLSEINNIPKLNKFPKNFPTKLKDIIMSLNNASTFISLENSIAIQNFPNLQKVLS